MTERKTLTLDSVLSEKIRKKLMTSIAVKQSEAKSQQQKKEKIFNAVKWLSTTYPKCFNVKDRIPFKLHIEKDIFASLPESAPSRIAIRQALKWYVQGEQYLKQIIAKDKRIDLEGNVLDDQPISAKDKEYAEGAINHLLSLRKKH